LGAQGIWGGGLGPVGEFSRLCQRVVAVTFVVSERVRKPPTTTRIILLAELQFGWRWGDRNAGGERWSVHFTFFGSGEASAFALILSSGAVSNGEPVPS